MKNALDILKERGFIEQLTHEDEIRKQLEQQTTFYIGFDPTADSLTIGGFVQVMAMKHMQLCGHRPIVLMGGGTGMVGDPTDKTEMRRMMFMEEITNNCNKIGNQICKYIDVDESGEKGVITNNAKWLATLQYIPFIREIGVHFSVNRMLTADCYRTRFEKGLSFLEFNYMLMQSYDFLELYRSYNCKIQMGGNDQWSNIIGGVELIRRADSGAAFGIATKLLTTTAGEKMGKTMSGAVWIDSNKTTPYEMFQYLRNIDDADVKNCLALLTFLPMDEVNRLGCLKDSEINKAKEVLAFETVKIIHGDDAANQALEASKALFNGGADSESVPNTEISNDRLENFTIIDALEITNLCSTRSEARRLVQQGSVLINNEKVASFDFIITEAMFKDGKLMLQKGKKSFHRIVLK